MSIADTIATQMGGIGRIEFMLNGRVLGLADGLCIKWPNKERSKGNYLEVKLGADDTYSMEFFNITNASKKSVAVYKSVFASQLTSLFRDQTGWALKL
jgi:hypothetical protein